MNQLEPLLDLRNSAYAIGDIGVGAGPTGPALAGPLFKEINDIQNIFISSKVYIPVYIRNLHS